MLNARVLLLSHLLVPHQEAPRALHAVLSDSMVGMHGALLTHVRHHLVPYECGAEDVCLAGNFEMTRTRRPTRIIEFAACSVPGEGGEAQGTESRGAEGREGDSGGKHPAHRIAPHVLADALELLPDAPHMLPSCQHTHHQAAETAAAEEGEGEGEEERVLEGLPRATRDSAARDYPRSFALRRTCGGKGEGGGGGGREGGEGGLGGGQGAVVAGRSTEIESGEDTVSIRVCL